MIEARAMKDAGKKAKLPHIFLCIVLTIRHKHTPCISTCLQVNHLNPVDEAMIADASCRLVAGETIYANLFIYCQFFSSCYFLYDLPIYSFPYNLNIECVKLSGKPNLNICIQVDLGISLRYFINKP